MHNDPQGRLAAAEEASRIREVYSERDQALAHDRYSAFQRGHLFSRQEAEVRLLDLLKQCGCRDLHDRCLIEIGCGLGYWLRRFVDWGARPESVVGIDVVHEYVIKARALVAPGVRVELGNALNVLERDHSFDVVAQLVMMSSVVEPQLRWRIAGEMDRILKPGGLVVWYDVYVGNPNNPHLRAITKSELRTLFPSYALHVRRTTLAPPLGRVVGQRSEWAYRALSLIPFARTHYAAVLEKPRQA
jgi:SAM-dependent methyltransferase